MKGSTRLSFELVFVRHGTTEGNERGLLHGRTDIPLSPVGYAEARRSAALFARTGSIGKIVTSPQTRALVTAREIESATGATLEIEPRLREFDFGDLEGVPFYMLQTHHPDQYFSLLDPEGIDHPFPNGESRRSLHSRVSGALDTISENADARPVVVVAHLIVIATAIAHLTSNDPNDAIRYLVRNCSISRLRLNEHRIAELVTLDDVSHLE
jgi:broad specificity phosphatase PhoE